MPIGPGGAHDLLRPRAEAKFGGGEQPITFTAALDALIRDYAAAIAAQDGLADAPPVEKLVPIIVERFINSDRAFRAPMHQAAPAVPHKPPRHSESAPPSREREADQPTLAGSE